ncbi:tRNA (adenosine(37)-N6)-threonylcarbamoyltransferase complex dimerization subunit type 1 TsaB [Marinomonas sp. 2405UD68-3]|uniref:tRNA (adenosine(37)-N6)-threonylcarbamoyltransferase complex dimerization subunit type 1 TsaB n=1 Tax=Marinomonas sp. 2405UD68-3 TaxID=3391835 RepID=UPI0039C95FFD
MSVILSIDTSTPSCSVALNINGVLLEDFRLAPRMHNDLILPMVDQLLSQAELSLGDIDAIAFGRGPGSFTGLRISAGVVQGLAYGADLPVIPVSTLEAMALEAYRKYNRNFWLSALDARMGEIYVGGFSISEPNGSVVVETLLSERVAKPDSFGVIDEPYNGVGSGWCYQNILTQQMISPSEFVDEDVSPRALYIGELAKELFDKGAVVSSYDAMPTYLRDEISWEKQPLKIGKR